MQLRRSVGGMLVGASALVFMSVPAFAVGGARHGARPHASRAHSTACARGNKQVADVSYVINGTRTVKRLWHQVHAGDTVAARFRLAPGCRNVELSFVSYRAPAATFSRATAPRQRLFDWSTGRFTGRGSLTVHVPKCFFQVDFVRGAVMPRVGGSNGHYGIQGRLIDTDQGGTSQCRESVGAGSTTTTTTVPGGGGGPTTTTTIAGSGTNRPPTTRPPAPHGRPPATTPTTPSVGGNAAGRPSGGGNQVRPSPNTNASVLGEELTRQPAPTGPNVLGVSLARTGTGTAGLALVAFGLLVVGLGMRHAGRRLS